MAAGHMSSLLKFALMYTVSLLYPLLGLVQLILKASSTCIIVVQGPSAWFQVTKIMSTLQAAIWCNFGLNADFSRAHQS